VSRWPASHWSRGGVAQVSAQPPTQCSQTPDQFGHLLCRLLHPGTIRGQNPACAADLIVATTLRRSTTPRPKTLLAPVTAILTLSAGFAYGFDSGYPRRQAPANNASVPRCRLRAALAQRQSLVKGNQPRQQDPTQHGQASRIRRNRIWRLTSKNLRFHQLNQSAAGRGLSGGWVVLAERSPPLRDIVIRALRRATSKQMTARPASVGCTRRSRMSTGTTPTGQCRETPRARWPWHRSPPTWQCMVCAEPAKTLSLIGWSSALSTVTTPEL
jgi:hypothetical protein